MKLTRWSRKKKEYRHTKVLTAKQMQDISKVHYWSDGASSQFKNRYMFGNLAYHKEELKMEADWSFFEIAHGKGAVDGIGGTIKHKVWRAILQGKEVVTNARSFYDVACKRSPENVIKLMFISKDLIAKEASAMKEKYSCSKSVPDTRSIHFVRPHPTKSNFIEYSQNSPFSSPEEIKQSIIFPEPILKHVPYASASASQHTKESVQKGQWIAVLFDENWWPGQVVEIDKRCMTVKQIFKPISENKFQYLEKPQFEKIPIHSYLSVLPCDPSPDQTARFFSYDLNIALKIKSIVNKV